MKKILLIVLLLALAGGGWWWYSTHRATTLALAADRKPEFVAAQVQPFRVLVEATGRVIPEQEIEIKCKASGEITQLPVDVSDPVKKGSLLVQLDPVDEDRSVKQAQVQLAQSQAHLLQARINLEIATTNQTTETMRAQAALASARARATDSAARLERSRQLRDKEMASQEELDAAVAAHEQAQADHKSAEARVLDLRLLENQLALRQQDIDIAAKQVESDQLTLGLANRRFQDTTVLAPIDGVVSERAVQVGQIIASGINNVGGGTTVMKLADLSHIYVMVSVDESDIGRVALGQPAEITVDAHPDILLPGRVVQIAAKGVVSANVVTFQVKVEVEGPNRTLLKPEMSANVAIETVHHPAALVVPLAAMIRQRRAWLVDVKTAAGGLDRRTVTVDASNGESIEILSGLTAGEEVVVRPLGGQDRWSKAEDAAPRPPPPPEGHP